jgi:hypothetical protein
MRSQMRGEFDPIPRLRPIPCSRPRCPIPRGPDRSSHPARLAFVYLAERTCNHSSGTGPGRFVWRPAGRARQKPCLSPAPKESPRPIPLRSAATRPSGKPNRAPRYLAGKSRAFCPPPKESPRLIPLKSRPAISANKKSRPRFHGAIGRLLVCGGASYFFYSMAWYPAGNPAFRTHAFFESLAGLCPFTFRTPWLSVRGPLWMLYKQWPCQSPR